MNQKGALLMPQQAVAYIRVSTEEQNRHNLSIEDQTTALQEWADSH